MADSSARSDPSPQMQDRRAWYDAQDLLSAVGVKVGSVCVDLGCGTGEFAFLLAQAVGKTGRVYAVDASVTSLDLLKLKKPGANIVTLRAELSDTRLPAGVCDLVLMPFSLSGTRDAGATLAEAARLLKPDGRLAVFEWRPVSPPPGPPIDRRLRSDRVQRLMEANGFTAIQRLREGAVYYTLLAHKGKAPAPTARPPAPPRPVRR